MNGMNVHLRTAELRLLSPNRLPPFSITRLLLLKLDSIRLPRLQRLCTSGIVPLVFSPEIEVEEVLSVLPDDDLDPRLFIFSYRCVGVSLLISS